MREAARFALYRWDEFRQLPSEDRAAIMAHYRAHFKLEALIAEYQSQQASAKAKAASKSRPRKR